MVQHMVVKVLNSTDKQQLTAKTRIRKLCTEKLPNFAGSQLFVAFRKSKAKEK